MKFQIIVLIVIIISASQLNSGTWKEIDEVIKYNDDSSATYQLLYRAIDCFDKNNCIAVGNLGLGSPWDRHTSDGGKTWNTSLRDTHKLRYNDDGTVDMIYDPSIVLEVEYVSKKLCIAVCDSGYFWRSTDSLKTWQRNKLFSDTISYYWSEITFFNEKYGGIVAKGRLYLTTDSGNTWYRQKFNLPDDLTPTYLTDISLPDINTILVLGGNKDRVDHILKSEDFGKTWEAYEPAPLRILKIFFINKNIGWACGKQQVRPYASEYRDIILHTTDGGKSWLIQLDTLAPIKKGLQEIYFIDKNNGIATGPYWKIWRTSDGGKKWIRDKSAEDYMNFQFTDAAMPDKDVIFAPTKDSKIYKYDSETGIFSGSNSESKFKIYPNPVSSGEEINIEITGELYSHIELKIYNSKGNKIDKSYNAFLNNGTKKIKYIPDKNLSQGVYFLHVKIGKEKFVEKFVVIE